MKILVTVTNYSKYCKPGKKILEDAGYEIIENNQGRPFTQNELEQLIDDIDGAIVGVDTWNEVVFSRAPKLKVLARFGVGVDNIDLVAAKNNNIIVCNTPGINSSAVAEQAIALLFSLMRQIPILSEDVRKGKWTRPMFHELGSRTIGLLGFGMIARQVAEKINGFHPEILAYDKFPNKFEAKRLGVKLVNLDELLDRSDIISIHLPATKETYHLINDKTILRMKDGVLLINTARGSIVNEDAVEKALTSEKIAGFGTDVFETEPVNIDGPLFKHKNYIATPHVSAETFENCERTSIITANQLIDVFDGRQPSFRMI